MKKLISIFIIISATVGAVFGQAATCLCNQNQMAATPFCTNENPYGLTYSAGTSGYASELYYLNNTGCLDEYSGGPNPAWFKMRISQAGNLTILLQHSNSNGDIDYACWGPFTDADMANMCANYPNSLSNYLYDNLASQYPSTYYYYEPQYFSHHPTYVDYNYYSTTYGDNWFTDWYNPNPSGRLVDCSSTPSPSEWIHIRNAQVGQWYIVLISNWAGYSGNITFSSDASSTAETDCTITSPVTGDEVCEGETATFTAQAASGAVNYEWTGPNNFSQTTTTNVLTINNVTMAQAGTYSVRVWNGSAYGNTTTCELIVHSMPNLTVNEVSICNGQPATLTASGADQYTWNTGSTTASITVRPETTTTYTVTGTNEGNCTATATTTVTVNNSINIELYDTTCYQSSYTGHGFHTDLEQRDEPYIETLNVSQQTASGCDSNVTLYLAVMPVFASSSDTSFCEGGSVEFYGETLTETGTYTHVEQSIYGCDSTITLRLTVGRNYEINDDLTICNTQLPYYYRAGDTTFTEGTPETGNYHFYRTTAAGCDSNIHLNLRIVENYLEVENLTEDFCENREAFLVATTSHQNIFWSSGETTPEIRVTHPGTYIVTAYTGSCKRMEQIYIEPCDFNLYLPNAFTPSYEDGVNDEFFIPEFIAKQMSDFMIVIYDRWGRVVFQSEDPFFHWNGKEKGKLRVNNTYTYRMDYRDVNGYKRQTKGIVTVL